MERACSGWSAGRPCTPKVSVDVRGEFWQNAFDGDAVFDDHGLAAELNRESQHVWWRHQLPAHSADDHQRPPQNCRHPFHRSVVSRHRYATDAGRRRAESAGAHLRLGARRVSRFSSAQSRSFRTSAGWSALPPFRIVCGPSTSIGFTFDRRTDFSYCVVEPYYVREGYGVSIRRQLPQQWDVELDATRTSHRVSFKCWGRKVTTRGTTGDRVDRGDATLGYDVGPRTRMTLGLVYQDRRSDFNNRRYDGIRVGASMIYGF